MDFPIRTLTNKEFPKQVYEIPEPPTILYMRGTLPTHDQTLLAVVGSRNYTDYGKEVVDSLISGLRGQPISIVSGLALGIDGLAHEAALRSNLHTLAVPGSGLEDSVLYPARHKRLAHEILESGGGLLSEYAPNFKATTWSFPQRNRIMAGLADAVLVIEATEKSGTLITSRLATEYNKDVFTVPGNIFSSGSKGPHMLIRLGATPITSSEDILDALNIDTISDTSILNEHSDPATKCVLEALTTPTDKDSLSRETNIPIQQLNILLMRLEIQGVIRIENGVARKL